MKERYATGRRQIYACATEIGKMSLDTALAEGDPMTMCVTNNAKWRISDMDFHDREVKPSIGDLVSSVWESPLCNTAS